MGTLRDNLSRLEEIEEIIINKDNVIPCTTYSTPITTTEALVRTNFILVVDRVKELLFQLDNQPYEIDLSSQGIVLHYMHQLNKENLWLEINYINTARLIIASGERCANKFEYLFSRDIKEEIEVSLTKIDIINKIINEFLK